MEQRLGLRPEVPGSTVFVDSLAMLLQFHVAGNLGHHAFGERVAAWERGLEFRTELLNRGNPRPRRASGNGLFTGTEPALATAGNIDGSLPKRPVEDLLGGLQVFMSKMDEGGMGKGPEARSVGREASEGSVDPNRLDREIANLLFTAKDNLNQGLQVFLDSLPMAAAVAQVHRGNKDFGRIYIVNRRFTELFGYSVGEANQHNITHYFNKLSLPGIMLRIFEIIGGGIFSPTNMDFRHRDGHYIKIRGSGVIRPVHGRTIAFGFYEPRELGEAADRAQNQVLGALASVGREQPLRSNEGAFEVRSVSELSGHLTRPGSPLLQQAQAQDLRITVTDMPWVQSPESYGDSLLRYFNIQSRKMEFPAGRRIVVEFPATDTRARASITLIKFMEEFRILGAGDTEAGNGNGINPDLGNGAHPPTMIPRVARPETTSPEGGTSTNGHAPDARTAASLERLQGELGSAMDRVRERVTREDVELTLQGEFESSFLDQSIELIQKELQALTQGRIKIPLGRQISVIVSTDLGPRRLVFKKVLLNFERLE